MSIGDVASFCRRTARERRVLWGDTGRFTMDRRAGVITTTTRLLHGEFPAIFTSTKLLRKFFPPRRPKRRGEIIVPS